MHTNPAPPRRSAAAIVIKPKPPFASEDDLISRLRALMATAGTNRHDQAIVVISACIFEGANTRARIIAIGVRLGFNHKHVAIQPKERTGNDPERHRWSRDDKGRFALLP